MIGFGDIVKGVTDIGGKIIDKIWMDKDEEAKLEFSKEELKYVFDMGIRKLEQDGEFKELEMIFQESQAQRDYAHKQFGTAEDLKTFLIGKVILLGRASIRWVITGFAMWQCHRLVTFILTDEVLAGLASGTLSTSGVWLIGLLVCMIIGIPLFYVTGISIEKLFKSRGIL